MQSRAIALLVAAPLLSCTVIRSDLLDRDEPGADASTRDSGSEDADTVLVDLALHYEFEGGGISVGDSSERSMDGTLSDLAARTSEGRTVGGLSLSGSIPPTQFVALPNGVLEGVDDFTISVWVKLNTVGAWSRLYDIGNGLPDPTNRFMYLTPSGASGIHAASYGGSQENESTLSTGTELPTGVWKHLALTGSGGDRTLFIDGFPAMAIEGSADVPPFEMEPVGPASWLGRSRFAADPGLDGTIDDFRIYGRVLSPSEIADIAWPQGDYSHWRFDGAATDSSDRAIATALVDGATWTTLGRLGDALDLGGGLPGDDGPHVVMSTGPLASCDEEMTIAVWVRLRSFNADAKLIDFGNTAGTLRLFLAPSNGTGTEFQLLSPAGQVAISTPSLLFAANDTWHHLAVTINSDDLAVLYVDGAVAMTETGAGIRPGDLGTVDDYFVGKSRSPVDPYLNGSLDELRIACRSFTADEIKNLSRR